MFTIVLNARAPAGYSSRRILPAARARNQMRCPGFLGAFHLQDIHQITEADLLLMTRRVSSSSRVVTPSFPSAFASVGATSPQSYILLAHTSVAPKQANDRSLSRISLQVDEERPRWSVFSPCAMNSSLNLSGGRNDPNDGARSIGAWA